jgi:hypothetical protein
LEKTKAYQPFSDKFKILYEKIEELFWFFCFFC